MIVTVTLNPAIDETLTVAELRVGETHRITETNIDPGGKGLNVSRVIQRLGRPTVAIALVGGESGHFIRDRLAREGVDTDLVKISRPTRINISILDDSTDVQTNFNQDGPRVEDIELNALEHRIGEWLPKAKVVVFGGSLPPGAPEDIYAGLIRWMRKNKIKAVLDTSREALIQGVKAIPYMIKPNVRETEQLIGRSLNSDDDIIDAACELSQIGIEFVVVSMGKDGAIAVKDNEVWKAIPPEVEIESAIGAGDSMVAGLSIGIMENMSAKDSLILGTAAATATVMTPGTDLCRPKDVKALLPRVKVEKIR